MRMAMLYKSAGLTMPAKMSGPYLAGKLLLIINFHIIYTIWGVRSFVMFCYILFRKLGELETWEITPLVGSTPSSWPWAPWPPQGSQSRPQTRQGDQGTTKVGKRISRVVSSVWALWETRITVVPDVNNNLFTFLIL